MFSEHDDEFDLNKEESSYKSAESAVVFGKLVENFDQSVTNVNEPVVRGNDDDDSTHEIDCSKEIVRNNIYVTMIKIILLFQYMLLYVLVWLKFVLNI